MHLSVKTVYAWNPPLIPTQRPRRVLLGIDTSGAYGRGLIEGISKYNRERGNWFMRLQSCLGCAQVAPEEQVDGMLIGVDVSGGSASIATLRGRASGAMVNVHPAYAQASGVPYVGVDEKQIAALAAQHLIDRGVEHFGFCGVLRGNNPSLGRRGEFFREFVENAGHRCALYSGEVNSDASAQERLVRWISGLQKPLGIMTANDRWGLRVLDACRLAGTRVPDEVAVIGVDNDSTLCDLALPPLSSVDANAEGIGYEAAALLDGLMNGQDAPDAPLILAPRGVVMRRSSDIIASEDEDISRAIRFIRERACCLVGLQVEDVLGYTGTSRASLQQRMKKVLGHTIHQEIQRARLARAKELLAMSGKTIKQVARESGFASVQYLTRVFRAGTGETPARYRSRRSV